MALRAAHATSNALLGTNHREGFEIVKATIQPNAVNCLSSSATRASAALSAFSDPNARRVQDFPLLFLLSRPPPLDVPGRGIARGGFFPWGNHGLTG